MSSTRITELAAIISANSAVVNDYFLSENIPAPSFDIYGPPRVMIPPFEREAFMAHSAVLAATKELHNLLLGPTDMLMGMNPNDMLSLQAIYRFRIASSFPVEDQASFEDISAKCNLNVIDLRRILRHGMTNNIFKEPRKGVVAHTAASKLLAEDPSVRDFVGVRCEEMFMAAARTVDALEKWGVAQEPWQTGFSLGHNTDLGYYDDVAKHPERLRRMSAAFDALASKAPLEPLFTSFDWKSLGKGTVVDVGGSYGAVAIGLAKRFPELSVIVQDFLETIKQGAARMPTELKDRVNFLPGSFLNEQTVKDADAYYFRAIFHNWPDAYCIKILQNQIPALKPGARIIINDLYEPEPNTRPPMLEKHLRSTDLDMLAMHGSRERGFDAWTDILKEADPRFKFVNAKVTPPGSIHAVLEVVWDS